jgi:cytochrome c biogenesis protein CcdA
VSTTVITYLLYLTISVSLTVWVASTLYRNGEVFLIDVFDGDERLAHSVNHLLVVGFYLVNLGYVTLALKIGDVISSAQQSIEALSVKVGAVLLVLGAMHFANLYVFSRIRRRARLDHAPAPPVAPSAWLNPYAEPGQGPAPQPGM